MVEGILYEVNLGTHEGHNFRCLSGFYRRKNLSMTKEVPH